MFPLPFWAAGLALPSLLSTPSFARLALLVEAEDEQQRCPQRYRETDGLRRPVPEPIDGRQENDEQQRDNDNDRQL